MDNAFAQQLFNEHLATPKCPSPQKVGEWFEKLLQFFFLVHVKSNSNRQKMLILAKLETDGQIF